MRVAVEAMPPATLVAVVNGWGTLPRAADGRSGRAYPPAGDLSGRLGVPAAVASALTGRALALVADLLHPVFATADPRECARLVTDLLTETAVRPEVGTEELRPYAGWSVADEGPAVLASAAVALRAHLAGPGPDRLGVCAGSRCADVYVDVSPGGRRRFCSVTCQNRARIAAFRSRRATA